MTTSLHLWAEIGRGAVVCAIGAWLGCLVAALEIRLARQRRRAIAARIRAGNAHPSSRSER